MERLNEPAGTADAAGQDRVAFAVSELLFHKQIILYRSWVTSLRHMKELLEHLVRWNLHPERIVTHRYPL